MGVQLCVLSVGMVFLLLLRGGLTGYFSSTGDFSYCVDDIMVFFGLVKIYYVVAFNVLG